VDQQEAMSILTQQSSRENAGNHQPMHSCALDNNN
jgi:hypothetical protein